MAIGSWPHYHCRANAGTSCYAVDRARVSAVGCSCRGGGPDGRGLTSPSNGPDDLVKPAGPVSWDLLVVALFQLTLPGCVGCWIAFIPAPTPGNGLQEIKVSIPTHDSPCTLIKAFSHCTAIS